MSRAHYFSTGNLVGLYTSATIVSMSWLTQLLDIFFPPSPYELRIRALTHAKLAALRTLPHARDTEHLFFYAHDDIRALIWQLKYKRDARAVDLLSTALHAHLSETVRHDSLVIPMPLSTVRMRERGFNQVNAICKKAVSELPFCILAPNILMRTHAAPQTTLTRYERLKNLSGTFYVPTPETVTGKDVILVDDVTTTGATFREAKAALIAANVRSVRCIALAH